MHIEYVLAEVSRMSISLNTLGVLHSFIRQGRSIVLDYGGPRVAVTVLTDGLVRVRLALDGEFLVRRSWAVARADEEFGEAAFEVEDSGRELLLRTTSLTVRIDRSGGSLSFEDVQGQLFCAD